MLFEVVVVAGMRDGIVARGKACGFYTFWDRLVAFTRGFPGVEFLRFACLFDPLAGVGFCVSNQYCQRDFSTFCLHPSSKQQAPQRSPRLTDAPSLHTRELLHTEKLCCIMRSASC